MRPQLQFLPIFDLPNKLQQFIDPESPEVPTQGYFTSIFHELKMVLKGQQFDELEKFQKEKFSTAFHNTYE